MEQPRARIFAARIRVRYYARAITVATSATRHGVAWSGSGASFKADRIMLLTQHHITSHHTTCYTTDGCTEAAQAIALRRSAISLDWRWMILQRSATRFGRSARLPAGTVGIPRTLHPTACLGASSVASSASGAAATLSLGCSVSPSASACHSASSAVRPGAATPTGASATLMAMLGRPGGCGAPLAAMSRSQRRRR